MSRLSRQFAGPVAAIAIVGYFAFYAIQGDRGYYALIHLKDQVASANQKLAMVQEERVRLERRSLLLRSDNLDTDMLDERARVMLSYTRANEVVVFFATNASDSQRQTVAAATPVAAH